MKATISIRELKAMSVFAAVEDKRKFLQGVRVEVTADSVIMLGTNGHVMGMLYGANPEVIDFEPGVVTIPLEAIKAMKHNKLLPWVTVSAHDEIPNMINLLDHQGERAVEQPVGHERDFAWRRVVPSGVSGEPPHGFDAEYIGRFSTFAREIRNSRDLKQCIHVFQNGEEPAIVKLAGFNNFFAVLMPFRVTKEGVPFEATLPAWYLGDDVSDLA